MARLMGLGVMRLIKVTMLVLVGHGQTLEGMDGQADQGGQACGIVDGRGGGGGECEDGQAEDNVDSLEDNSLENSDSKFRHKRKFRKL